MLLIWVSLNQFTVQTGLKGEEFYETHIIKFHPPWGGGGILWYFVPDHYAD